MAEGVISRTPLCGIWWEGHLFLQRRPHLVTGRIRQAMWLSGFKMMEGVWAGENGMGQGKEKEEEKISQTVAQGPAWRGLKPVGGPVGNGPLESCLPLSVWRHLSGAFRPGLHMPALPWPPPTPCYPKSSQILARKTRLGSHVNLGSREGVSD